MIINLNKNLELSTKLRISIWYLLVLIYYSVNNVSHSSHIYILSIYSNSIYCIIFWELVLSLCLSSVFILLLSVLCVFFISVLRLHSLIKFKVMWWLTLFGNNDAWCIWLTPVLIVLDLSFCFNNSFVNILLGLICISILSALLLQGKVSLV